MLALDVETLPISPRDLAPRVVCCSFALDPESGVVVGNSPDEGLEGSLKGALEGEVVGHNVAFDMMSIIKTFPRLSPMGWKAYSERRVHDTLVREKLVHLGTHGSIDVLAGARINYSLSGIAHDRLGPTVGQEMMEDKSSGIRVRYVETSLCCALAGSLRQLAPASPTRRIPPRRPSPRRKRSTSARP